MKTDGSLSLGGARTPAGPAIVHGVTQINTIDFFKGNTLPIPNLSEFTKGLNRIDAIGIDTSREVLVVDPVSKIKVKNVINEHGTVCFLRKEIVGIGENFFLQCRFLN